MFESARCHKTGKVLKNALWKNVYQETTQVLFDRMNNYTDHLGNIRLRYAKDPEAETGLKILEEDHYYPFGLKHKGYNNEHNIFYPPIGTPNKVMIIPITPDSRDPYKYKYNGKEFQDELGLDWYDYGARNYDASLGRWMNVDPLAEKTPCWSPYAYVHNNPLRYTDPTGMSADDVIIKGKDADKAVYSLNAESELNLKRDQESGLITITNKVEYSKLNKKDQRLYNAINDKEKTVNLSTTRDVKRSNGVFVLGKHNGQTLTDGFQEVNMEQAINLENGSGEPAGSTVFHEIDESYAAMEIVNDINNFTNAMREQGASVGLFNPKSNVYSSAHRVANSNDPDKIFNPKSNQLYLQTDTNPATLWYNSNPNANANNSSGWFKLNNK